MLIVLYLLCHGLYIILGNFTFFDDVWLFNSSPDIRNEIFKQHGYEFIASFHDVLILLHPITVRTLIFITILFQAFLIYKIFVSNNIKCSNTIFITLALFLLSPYNISRINAINFPSQIFICLFLLGFLYQDKHFGLSLVFYFISFYCHSLLFLFSVPFFLFVNKMKMSNFPSKSFYPRLFFFAILPFLFWFYKLHYHMPFGYHTSYNIIFLDYEIFSNLVILAKNFLNHKDKFYSFYIYIFIIMLLYSK